MVERMTEWYSPVNLVKVFEMFSTVLSIWWRSEGETMNWVFIINRDYSLPDFATRPILWVNFKPLQSSMECLKWLISDFPPVSPVLRIHPSFKTSGVNHSAKKRTGFLDSFNPIPTDSLIIPIDSLIIPTFWIKWVFCGNPIPLKWLNKRPYSNNYCIQLIQTISVIYSLIYTQNSLSCKSLLLSYLQMSSKLIEIMYKLIKLYGY